MGDKTRGLYNKFQVVRVDRSDEPGGKHYGCEYFVLDVTHDPHAKAALLAYANSCEADYALLAADLRAKYPAAPSASAASEPDGFTPWNGGDHADDRPVHLDAVTVVDVRLRSGEVMSGAPNAFDWRHTAWLSDDIIAYRAAPSPAPEAGMAEELRAALIAHRLETDKPSQIADSFRNGWIAALRALSQGGGK